MFGTWTIVFLATVMLLTIAALGTIALAYFGPDGEIGGTGLRTQRAAKNAAERWSRLNTMRPAGQYPRRSGR